MERLSQPDNQVRSLSFPSHWELGQLLTALETLRLSPATQQLFRRLAELPPEIRLAVNLKAFLKQNILCEITQILREGVTPAEYQALAEVDCSSLPLKLREVAHGLLSIRERWLLWQALKRSFKDARGAAAEYVQTEES